MISVQNDYLKSHPADRKQIDPHSFTIHYAVKSNKSAKWSYKNITLKHAENLIISLWVKNVQNCIQGKLNDLL